MHCPNWVYLIKLFILLIYSNLGSTLANSCGFAFLELWQHWNRSEVLPSASVLLDFKRTPSKETKVVQSSCREKSARGRKNSSLSDGWKIRAQEPQRSLGGPKPTGSQVPAADSAAPSHLCLPEDMFLRGEIVVLRVSK